MPTSLEWQLQNPLDAVIFDCDGTLCSIEGIDELAKENKVGEQVMSLTAAAMNHLGINPTIYDERLKLILPTEQQVTSLGLQYQASLVPNVRNVIELLQRLGKTIYIVSAGLRPAVVSAGSAVNIPDTQIFAVDISFNADGSYQHFDATSPLINSDGKCVIASQIKQKHPALALIGDGLNDLITQTIVTRFIGYGGVYYRENIAKASQFYIESMTMATALPLLLTAAEVSKLDPQEALFYEYGLNHLRR